MYSGNYPSASCARRTDTDSPGIDIRLLGACAFHHSIAREIDCRVFNPFSQKAINYIS